MTDVERQEEQFLAATDAKAQGEAGQRGAATGQAPVDAGDPSAADMSQRRRGPLGLRRRRDHGRRRS